MPSEPNTNVSLSPLAGRPAPKEFLIDVDALAVRLQDGRAKSFVKLWTELMAVIISKSAALKKAMAG